MEVNEMSEGNFENKEDMEVIEESINIIKSIPFAEMTSIEVCKWFKEKDMLNIVGMMKSLSDEYVKLRDQVEILNDKNKALQAEIDHLYDELLGTEKHRCKTMRELYECGISLRQISKMLHCDKSTVKRKLLKMGVPIRK